MIHENHISQLRCEVRDQVQNQMKIVVGRLVFCKRVMLFLLVALSFAIGCIESWASDSYSGRGKDSVSKDEIESFRAKSLPADLSRKIQSFFDIRSPGLGMLNLKNKSFYFGWRITGTVQVYRVDAPKGFPIQMTGGEDPTTLLDITKDGKYLILSRDRNGEENQGLYLQPAEGGSLIEIQHKPKVQTAFAFCSDDSRFIYFRANDERADSYTIYRYDLKTKTKEKIFSESGYWTVADHWTKDSQDQTLLLGKAITNTSTEFYELDLKTKKLSPLLGQGENASYDVSYANKQNQFLVRTNRFSDSHRLYLMERAPSKSELLNSDSPATDASFEKRFKLFVPTEAEVKAQSFGTDVAQGDGEGAVQDSVKGTENIQLKPVFPMEDEIESFSVDPTHHTVAVLWNRKGYTRVEFFNLQTRKKLKLSLKQEQADQVYVGAWSKDGNQVVLGIDSGTAPKTSYSLDLRTNKLRQWVVASVPEVDVQKFVRAQLITIPSDFGGIPAFVRIPPGCEKPVKPCPVVVHFHGGPEMQSRPAFIPQFQLFVAEGMIFLEPNVRGSEGYGRKYLDADNAEKRLDVIKDIQTVADFAKTKWAPPGQKAKVGVMGWSYGGYSALYAMTKFAGSYDAGVSLVGMSHLVSFINNTAPSRRALRTPEYGDPEKIKDVMEELSPITHVDKIRDPLLIIQGVSDSRVPVGEALQMHKKMQEKKLAGDLILFADEGHLAQKRSNQVLEIGHTVLFFKKHLF